MSYTRREKVLAAIIFVLLFVVLTTGSKDSFSPQSAFAKQKSTDIFSQLKIFTDVLALIQKEYVSEVNGSDLIEGAIKGMLTNLDPHSSYLNAEFYQDLQVQTKGEFGGLGLEITLKDLSLTVVAPMEGGPAQKAGIIAGDVIVKIDGKLTKDFSMVDAVRSLRGPKGTPVTIGVFRKSSQTSFEVTLNRDIIQVKSIRSRQLEDGYGYVRVSQFLETTGDDMYMALRKLERQSANQEIKGLILDLRNNPGGLLNQAVRISDMFIEDGVLVYTDGRIESQKQKFFAQRRGTEPKYPLVVLVNNGSASASEIVAGALKEDGRALIVGTRTFGKGSVQTVTRLENGGGLSLTTALYYLKNGESIQLKGVTPDIEIENPTYIPNNRKNKMYDPNVAPSLIREDSLPGAIANPFDPIVGEGNVNQFKPSENTQELSEEDMQNLIIDYEKEPLDSWFKKDPQMAKAFEVLKGF